MKIGERIKKILMSKKVTIPSIILVCSFAVTIHFTHSSNIEATESKTNIKVEPKAAAVITESNYKTWTAATLNEAQVEVTKFLQGNKPFTSNTKWTVGALNTLDSVLTASKNAVEGVSSDLIREQMIQSVQKLETKTAFETGVIGEFAARNNHADNNLQYSIDYTLNGASYSETMKYDIVFILDWSASMGSSLGTISNGRLHAKDMIEAMAKKLLTTGPSQTRIRLLGVNSDKNNEPSNISTIQLDTGFFGKNDDYNKIIENAYSENPRFDSDNIPRSIREVTGLWSKDARQEAQPILFVFSDFHLDLMYDVRSQYIDSLTNYKNTIANLYDYPPQYYGIAYINFPFYYQPVKTNPIFYTPNWGYLEITESNAPYAVTNFTNLLEDTLTNTNWKTSVDSQYLHYITGSFNSSSGDIFNPQSSPTSLMFSGNSTDAKGNYQVRFDRNKMTDFKKGETFPSNDTSHIEVGESETVFAYKKAPELFAPVTDMAIEYYRYKGAGLVNNPNNYVLKETIVSQNYNSFSGREYNSQNAKLASIGYGGQVSKAQAIEILKDHIDADEFSNMNLNGNGNPTAPSLTVSFDSSKNVYRLYDSAEIDVAEITIEHENVDRIENNNYIGDQIDTKISIATYEWTKLNNWRLLVELPEEMSKPSELWFGKVKVPNVNNFYIAKTETTPHAIRVPSATNAIIGTNGETSIKYRAQILDTNSAKELKTTARLTGNNDWGAPVLITETSYLLVTDNPTVTVSYLDQTGQQLMNAQGEPIPDITLTDSVGSDYDVSGSSYERVFEGYELDKEQLPKNVKGKFESSPISVKYVYKKINPNLLTKGIYAGRLSFAWAPKSFELGTRRAVLLNNVFDLESASKDKQWLVVNEDRKDDNKDYGKKWTLNAKLGELKAVDGTTISGSQLFFKVNDIRKYIIGSQMNALGTDLVPNDPNELSATTNFLVTPNDILLGGATSGPDKQMIKLISDGPEVKVIEQTNNRTATEKTREGYATKLSDQKLIVPRVESKDYSKEFTTQVVWTLSRDITP